MYSLVKHLHMMLALVSICLFILSYFLLLNKRPLASTGVFRIAPHLLDTALLLSAIMLMYLSHQYPGQMPWLTEKFILVLLYIALGFIAIRQARSEQARPLLMWSSFIAALVMVVAIVKLALTKVSFI